MKKNLKNIVGTLLKNKHHLRDCDRRLVMSVWFIQVDAIEGMRALDLMNFIISHPKAVDSWDSITRMRRKLQEDHPELRGQTWNKRHVKAEQVRTDIVESNTLNL